MNQFSYNAHPETEQIQGRPGSSRKKNVRFQENAEENKSLYIEGENEEIVNFRNQKQNELKNVLAQQIEENR